MARPLALLLPLALVACTKEEPAARAPAPPGGSAGGVRIGAMTFRTLPSSAADFALGAPAAVAVSRPLRDQLRGQRVFVAFALSVAALHASSLLANALAFRWIDPASMGVWHTLLLAASYLGVVRLGVVNGMGRELPFALGSGDVPRSRAIPPPVSSWQPPSSSHWAGPRTVPGGSGCPRWRS